MKKLFLALLFCFAFALSALAQRDNRIESSTALEASRILLNRSGHLVSLVGYNAKTSAQFIQIFNTTSVPADGAVPIYTFSVPASSNFSIDIPTPAPFTVGISVSNSSTVATKTIGSADVWYTAVVRRD